MRINRQLITLYAVPMAIGIASSQFIVRISLIEIAAVFWFLFFGGFRKFPLLFRQDCAFAGLVYLSSLGLLISDLVNATTFENLVKGAGAYFLFPTTLFFLISIYGRSQLWLLMLGSSIPGLFSNEGIAEHGLSQDGFKFGYSSILILGILTIGFLLRRFYPRFSSARSLTLISALLIACLGLWGNLRLVSLCAIVALCIDQACSFAPLKQLILRSQSMGLRLLFFLITFPFLLVGISSIATQLFNFLINAISNSFISEDALNKTLSQSSGPLGVLFGGRSEVFSSYLAWIERPLLGWGSWAADPSDHFYLAGQILMRDLGYDVDISGIINSVVNVGSFGLIPTHSALLNTLVWGGIIAFLPLYIVICQFTINLFEMGALKDGYCYPILFVHTLCLWTLLFSPFGYDNRLGATLMMASAVSHFRGLVRSNHSNVLVARTPRSFHQ